MYWFFFFGILFENRFIYRLYIYLVERFVFKMVVLGNINEFGFIFFNNLVIFF